MVVRREGITVVGGGGGALGSAVVHRLVAAGRPVVVPSRHPGRSAPIEGVTEIQCDLDDLESVARLRNTIDAMGAWKALVSASGGYVGGRAHEVEDSVIEGQIAANLLGPWRLARAAAASMVAGGAGGRIVIVASRAAVEVTRGQAAYQVSKAAVLKLAQVMAAELQGRGITVNAVLPGTMDTPANRASFPATTDFSKWPSVADVAETVAFLASPENRVTRGALVPVYGKS